MPVAYQTLPQVRRSVGALAYTRQHFNYGGVTATDGTNYVEANPIKSWPDDTLKGHTAYIPRLGEQRTILSQGQANGRLFFTSPTAGTINNATDFVEVWPADVDPFNVNLLIQQAVLRASDVSLVYAEAAPVTYDSTRKILTLPSTWVRFAGVQYFYNGILYLYDYRDIPDPMIDSYTLRGRSVYLSTAIPAGATDVLVQGYRPPVVPSSEASLVEVNPAFAMYYTAYMLEAGDAAQPGYDPEASAPRAQVWLREAMQIYSTMPTAWQSNTRELPL